MWDVWGSHPLQPSAGQIYRWPSVHNSFFLALCSLRCPGNQFTCELGEGRAWAVGLDAHSWILTPLCAISVTLGKLLNSTMPRHPHHWGEGSNSTYIIELLWRPMNNMFEYFQKHLEHSECPINNSHGDWYQFLGQSWGNNRPSSHLAKVLPL